MTKTKVLRTALYIGAFFNLTAALMLAFPSSLGKLFDLPEPGAHFYASLLSALVGMLGLAYAWMAAQPQINRPMLTLAAAGKIAVFVISLFYWLADAISFRAFSVAVGDLIFGAIFFWWLLTEKKEA